jgi:hypothetical protein
MTDRPVTIYVSHEPDLEVLARRLDNWPKLNAGECMAGRAALDPAGPESAALRDRLAGFIRAADVFICLISRTCFADPWMLWELRQAVGASPRPGMVGILLHEHARHPAGIDDRGAIFVPFRRDAVQEAIAWAATNRPAAGDFTLAEQ